MVALCNVLSKVERSRFRHCEARIERGQIQAEEVFLALMEIRDQQLYREEYDTFEEYCRQRWNTSRRHVNRLIHWVSVNENLGPRGPILEKQARPLKGLSAAQQCEVIDEARQEAQGEDDVLRASRIAQIAAKIKNRARYDGVPADKSMAELPPAIQKRVVEYEQEQVRDQAQRNQELERRKNLLNYCSKARREAAHLPKDEREEYLPFLDGLISKVEKRKAM